MGFYRELVDPDYTFDILSLKELDSITKGKRSNCKLDTSKLEVEGFGLPEVHEAVSECLVKYKENLKRP